MGLAIAAIAVVVAAAQLLLPRFAAAAIRQRLARDGRVLSVRVSAFPAARLLWRHADSVSVRMADYTRNAAELGGLLREAAEVTDLSVELATFTSGVLTVHDVELRKHGSQLDASARIAESDLRAALPILGSVSAVTSQGGEIKLRGTGGAFGISAALTVAVSAVDGRIVVTPSGVLSGLLNLTVWNDPGVYVQALSASSIPGGLRVSIRAELR